MGNSFYIQETHAGTLAKAGEIMRLFDMNQEGFISRDKFLGVMAVFEIARAQLLQSMGEDLTFDFNNIEIIYSIQTKIKEMFDIYEMYRNPETRQMTRQSLKMMIMSMCNESGMKTFDQLADLMQMDKKGISWAKFLMMIPYFLETTQAYERDLY